MTLRRMPAEIRLRLFEILALEDFDSCLALAAIGTSFRELFESKKRFILRELLEGQLTDKELLRSLRILVRCFWRLAHRPEAQRYMPPRWMKQNILQDYAAEMLTPGYEEADRGTLQTPLSDIEVEQVIELYGKIRFIVKFINSQGQSHYYARMRYRETRVTERGMVFFFIREMNEILRHLRNRHLADIRETTEYSHSDIAIPTALNKHVRTDEYTPIVPTQSLALAVDEKFGGKRGAFGMYIAFNSEPGLDKEVGVCLERSIK